jgi:hypothetical protein
MIGFIDTLFTVLGITSNYSAMAILHILQFTSTHALGFSVFTSRILVTDVTVSPSLQITHDAFFASPNSVHYTDEQHPMPLREMQSALMLTVEFSKMYYTR